MAKQRKSFEEQIKDFNPEDHKDKIEVIEPSDSVTHQVRKMRTRGLNDNQISSMLGINLLVVKEIV